jgi:hypothetical protein
MQLQQPTPKFIRTVYDVEVIKDGARSPFNAGCKTLTEARDLAATRARAGGATVIELDWRQDIKNETRDGIFVCEIRQNVAEPGWPRVYS